MRLRLLVALLTFASAGRPSPGRAQTLGDLLAGIQQGGGWVSIPITAGHGALSTVALPTAGLKINGCVQVWAGHSGLWDIHARDTLGEGHLDLHAEPGESVTFTYAPGLRSQLKVDVRWSEPRDTTLLLWVGLQRPGEGGEDTCRPHYGGSG